MWRPLLKILFPPHCRACRTALSSGILCKNCFESIPLSAALQCGACGSRLPDGTAHCHPQIPYLLGAAASYAHPAVRALIHDLKFNAARETAGPLAELLVRYAGRIPLLHSFTAIVPIPLSPARERARGFNQAELLARPLAAHYHIPLVSEAFVRTRYTMPQSELTDHEARRENVRGCFLVQKPELIAKKSILLVDDVVTSGGTLCEAAATLKRAGARRIVALTVAKA